MKNKNCYHKKKSCCILDGAQRTKARAEKDWETADRIRDELKARHVVLEDTPQGIKWRIEK